MPVGTCGTGQAGSTGIARVWHGFSSASEPVWEAVSQAESAGGQALFIRCTYRVRVGGARRVRVGGQWREQRVEDIGGKGHERGEGRIVGREGELEA